MNNESRDGASASTNKIEALCTMVEDVYTERVPIEFTPNPNLSALLMK